MGFLFTSESVSEGHPDKVSDQISDAILDEFLRRDANSKVACETLCTTGLVVVAGEVRSDVYAQIAFGDIYVKNVNHTAMLETATNDDKGIYEFIRQKDGSYTIKDTKTKELLTSMRQKNNVDLFFTNIDDTKNQAFFLRKLKKGYALQPSDTAYAVCGVKGEKAERTTPIQINRMHPAEPDSQLPYCKKHNQAQQ